MNSNMALHSGHSCMNNYGANRAESCCMPRLWRYVTLSTKKDIIFFCYLAYYC